MTYADKPWLKSYKLGPYKLAHSLAPLPEVPVYKALDDAVENFSTQTAILFQERKIRYRELKEMVDKLASALVAMDVKRGDRVCIFMPNCPEFIISDWATMRVGAVVVPTSTLRTEDGLIHEIGSSQSRVVVCREEHLERVLAVKERCAIEHIIVTSTQGYDVQPIVEPLPDGVHEFRQLLDAYDPLAEPVAIDPKQDLCELAFTGGATGVPKGVMVTHFSRYCSILQGFPWMLKPMLRGVAGKASVFLPVPLFHAYGHYTHQAAAHLALRVILMPDPRDIEALVETIKKYRPFMIPTVPTQLMRIVQAKIGKMNVMPICAAAPLPLEISEAIQKEIGTPISEGYGLTETSGVTHFNISAFSKVTGFMPKAKTGMGVPAPDTECRLIDSETGEEVPVGEPGVVLVRGPQVMKGYWPEPGSGLTEDGWLNTGDIAYMDEDGYFHMSDRIKDMVNVSGMKVYTTTVDEILYKHPGVEMAAAIGVPDPENPGSERVMAFVQLRSDYENEVTSDEIRNFCREHLAPYAVPKFVEFRDTLPMTVTEKLFKKALRDEVVERLEKTGQIARI